jgi:hypothetical protein
LGFERIPRRSAEKSYFIANIGIIGKRCDQNAPGTGFGKKGVAGIKEI